MQGKSGVSNSGAHPVHEGPVLLLEEIQMKLKHHRAENRVLIAHLGQTLKTTKGQQSKRMLDGKEKIGDRAG